MAPTVDDLTKAATEAAKRSEAAKAAARQTAATVAAARPVPPAVAAPTAPVSGTPAGGAR